MRLRTTLIAAACSLFALPALADGKSDAARLFKEGQDLMKAQKFADACPKFEDSQKLDAQLGTVLNLAFCREKLGSTWLSWLAYRDAELRADSVGKRDRAEFARQHLTELEKNLPRVTLDCSGADRLDELMVEERLVPGAGNGQPFTAEPGRRTFRFEKSGKKPASIEVLVQERRSTPQRVACPTLEDRPVATPPPPTDGVTDTPPPPPAPLSHTAAYLSFGVGALGLATGSVFGIMTLGKKADSEKECIAQTKECTKAGKSILKTADAFSYVSDGGFVLAVVGVALGTYFLITAPSAPPASTTKASAMPRLVPTVSRDGAGAAFFTTF